MLFARTVAIVEDGNGSRPCENVTFVMAGGGDGPMRKAMARAFDDRIQAAMA
jgi:hypothetical protein